MSIKDTTLFITKTLKVNISLYKFPFKLLSNKLNLRFYNKLSKEIEDFAD